MASLVASEALDIRIATRPGEVGIYHEKVGIFRDDFGNTVSFIGSANETWNAWHERGNYESVEVFCSSKEIGTASESLAIEMISSPCGRAVRLE